MNNLNDQARDWNDTRHNPLPEFYVLERYSHSIWLNTVGYEKFRSLEMRRTQWWIYQYGCSLCLFRRYNNSKDNYGYCIEQRIANWTVVATDDDEIDNTKFQSRTVAVPITTTIVAPIILTELVLNKDSTGNCIQQRRH